MCSFCLAAFSTFLAAIQMSPVSKLLPPLIPLLRCIVSWPVCCVAFLHCYLAHYAVLLCCVLSVLLYLIVHCVVFLHGCCLLLCHFLIACSLFCDCVVCCMVCCMVAWLHGIAACCCVVIVACCCMLLHGSCCMVIVVWLLLHGCCCIMVIVAWLLLHCIMVIAWLLLHCRHCCIVSWSMLALLCGCSGCCIVVSLHGGCYEVLWLFLHYHLALLHGCVLWLHGHCCIIVVVV